MEAHPDDLTAASDFTLVGAARAGDRLAFGVLYFRHHAAAWRVACVVSRFSSDAELAVIEGFTRVFSALPRESEEFASGDVSFRPYLLACVRQAALDRARTAARANGSDSQLAGLAANGELVLSSLEHHVAREALAALPERLRTTLWLSEVEAMTPAEVAGVMGAGPEEIAAAVDHARNELRAASQTTLGGHEVRAGCRFTVANLEPFQAGTLDPAKGVLVRSHLDLCATCRMRLGELVNAPATLAAAVPAAPLLGGEAQHRWLTSADAGEVRPADRLLPPGLAAAAPAVLPKPARRLTVAAAGVSGRALRAGRTVRPALPVASLVVVWLAVMLSLPQLMEPATAPGPAGLALPAVQAYVPEHLPGRGAARPTTTSPAGAGAGTDFALQSRADQASAAAPAAEPVVKLVATAIALKGPTTSSAARPTEPSPRLPVLPVVPAVPPAITTAAAVTPTVVAAAAIPAATPAVTPTVGETKPSKALNDLKRRFERKLQLDGAPVQKPRRLDIASLRPKAREEFDGRVGRRETRRRHTDHPESA